MPIVEPVETKNLNSKKFGCYHFGSRAKGTHFESSDVDLFLICEPNVRTDVEFNMRIQLAQKYPQWLGLNYDIKHAPVGEVLPKLPIEVLILAELKTKNVQPVLGEDLLHQTITIPRELLLKAELSILAYWANIFFKRDFQKSLFQIQRQQSLRSIYSCVQSYFTYLALYQNPHLNYIDQENIPDEGFQKFRLLVQQKLKYNFKNLDPVQASLVFNEVEKMHFFCFQILENLNRQGVRRTA